MIKKITKKLLLCTCNKCGYSWESEKEPKLCNNHKCRSKCWNREDKRIKKQR